MEADEDTLEEKCMNLMSIVVESRKQFGKRCVDYHQKDILMRNKLLNLRIDTISNYKRKPEYTVPVNEEDEDREDFMLELAAMSKRFEDVRKKLKNTQEIVLQHKNDRTKPLLRKPLSDVILAKARKIDTAVAPNCAEKLEE